jgi:hypothetical protein
VKQPLRKLTNKLVPFSCGPDQKRAFAELKTAFTMAPVLDHLVYEKVVVLETDASRYISTGVLSQYYDQGVLHLATFFSKKHSTAKEKYEIYDPKFGAIFMSLEPWRPECESSTDPMNILMDHKNLEYFMMSKLQNQRQTRWCEFLSRFKCKIVFCTGRQDQKPDTLTRMPGDIPLKGGGRKTPTNRAKHGKPGQSIIQNAGSGFAETINLNNNSTNLDEL